MSFPHIQWCWKTTNGLLTDNCSWCWWSGNSICFPGRTEEFIYIWTCHMARWLMMQMVYTVTITSASRVTRNCYSEYTMLYCISNFYFMLGRLNPDEKTSMLFVIFAKDGPFYPRIGTSSTIRSYPVMNSRHIYMWKQIHSQGADSTWFMFISSLVTMDLHSICEIEITVSFTEWFDSLSTRFSCVIKAASHDSVGCQITQSPVSKTHSSIFACRAFSDTTLVCFIVNEHTTKCSRYNNTHMKTGAYRERIPTRGSRQSERLIQLEVTHHFTKLV